MSLIVMKFGGTSVSTAENRSAAITHVREELRSGNQVVVVVSAMGRKGMPYATDTLLSLLRGENLLVKDQLISCGETISACVFADELSRHGIAARPFTGESARIVTDDAFGSAAVMDMDVGPLAETLATGIVPVVTGFQGRTSNGFATTLGRGGSDTSAVLIGGYLKADVVDIYTDVPGVAKADPRIVPDAAFMDTISQWDMLTLAQWGSRVIHPKAVQAAMDFCIPLLRVRPTFDDKIGTDIGTDETPGLAGIAVLMETDKIPEAGRMFAGTLPAGSAIVTVVYHGEASIVRRAVAGYPVNVEGDVFHIGIPQEDAQKETNRIYQELSYAGNLI